MKIIVLNLSRETTKEELVTLFKAYGQVSSCDLVMDKQTGKSKGFAFIAMPDVDAGNAAIAALHGQKVGTHKIRVKLSDQSK